MRFNVFFDEIILSQICSLAHLRYVQFHKRCVTDMFMPFLDGPVTTQFFPFVPLENAETHDLRRHRRALDIHGAIGDGSSPGAEGATVSGRTGPWGRNYILLRWLEMRLRKK